ncbi:MAG: MFS transporter [Candidatus Altiarchaeum hamiconexum]|uniref:MFS transporter n=2 Tax=Candidatus Altarchaeum hamiconexum TaxID=1803513 RepID=A0A8J8CIP9_9ARCH|nr:MFS transporter [Candidatus Altarchaeum hamiconexum]OIQ04844.1 MAG: hypothetical protein AUK59_06090 [Candidatus Altarchaeum sp. CG2_30_32_3053]PIV28932.1 MAG: hypothetical protein COS36_00440 [Candidatus Altarchaeum sp. CG03_land_8_20_14_0_80_32_618]PIX49113.1 MAG: hypothetical protein COZ53_01655 [Candidatus Altarchaeum sp. CG_4_8_14_3_um_filter_33_2054]PIZ30934.1 MAG: hypothetical protein COY41_03335 [Candidatus Altarchaeum sp. CG_4_10_14_0_8_um_filter_32_851]
MNVDKNFLVFSVSFGLIFFSFAAAQQYLAVEFNKTTNADIAFTSLLLIYLFAAIFSPLSAYIVSKFNPKKGMIMSGIVYLLFCGILVTKNETVIYIVSALLGIASSILWTSCGTYILSITAQKYYGRALGIFNTVFSLMCILGMLTLGVLLSYYDFKISYLLILIPGIAGFFMLFLINDLKISKTIDFKEGLKNFFNPKFLIFLPLYVAQGFLFSLTIGIIPIEIKSMFSEIFIGIFGMLFYLIPLFSAYRVGKISDRIGRPALFVTFYILIGTAMLILLNKENFIIGISVFAVAFSFTKVLLIAYVGDLCKGKNLESGNALFNTALNLGVVFGFLTLMLIENNNMDNNLIYIISFFITILSLLGFVAKRKFK